MKVFIFISIDNTSAKLPFYERRRRNRPKANHGTPCKSIRFEANTHEFEPFLFILSYIVELRVVIYHDNNRWLR